MKLIVYGNNMVKQRSEIQAIAMLGFPLIKVSFTLTMFFNATKHQKICKIETNGTLLKYYLIRNFKYKNLVQLSCINLLVLFLFCLYKTSIMCIYQKSLAQIQYFGIPNKTQIQLVFKIDHMSASCLVQCSRQNTFPYQITLSKEFSLDLVLWNTKQDTDTTCIQN